MIKAIGLDIYRECAWCHKHGKNFTEKNSNYFCSSECQASYVQHQHYNDIITKFVARKKIR